MVYMLSIISLVKANSYVYDRFNQKCFDCLDLEQLRTLKSATENFRRLVQPTDTPYL